LVKKCKLRKAEIREARSVEAEFLRKAAF